MSEQTRPTGPSEVELKFVNRANSQLKFSPIESAAVIVQKMKTLCSLLGIHFGDVRDEHITDEYYDDAHRTLLAGGHSFRHRQENTRSLVTLKVAQNNSSSPILERLEEEFDCNDDEIARLVIDPGQVRARFDKAFGPDSMPALRGTFEKVLRVHNNRTTAALRTSLAEYTFAYDKYFYFDETTGRYSEYFAEIEIELRGQSYGMDVELEKLRAGISSLLGYAANDRSKFQRGLRWVGHRESDVQTVYSVGFDIVKYSRRPADLQKQIIQAFNRMTKEAIREIRGSEGDHGPIYLPTGDGMILVFEDKPETLVAVVRQLQKKVKIHNDGLAPDERFEFRTGLHAGAIFRYSDVNENVNFAGNGINLVQRVMNAGGPWHVLATKEAYEAMGNINSQNHRLFNAVGIRPIKHGETIEVFNIIDHDSGFGNPANP
jgi:class 3 adenylate cyclase